MNEKIHLRDGAGREWSIPLTEALEIVTLACQARDKLAEALRSAKNLLEAADDACRAMATESNAKEVQEQWRSTMSLLKAAFDPIDRASHSLMSNLRWMLAK